MAQQDIEIQSTNPKNGNFIPRLRRNRFAELRWGNKYYEAVKEAVFSMHTIMPYMPVEPPQSIKKEIDKTGYVCKQCRDCFRFLSSIEEHTSRRSWVLGFWCQHCFLTICAHKAPGKPNCTTCVEVETSKHDYLRNKGIKKNSKKGVTKIFYNQCQFFAHLKIHGISSVDLGDLMLMPLPYGFRPDQNAELDRIWRAVMEVMFIKRIHIMDWLREKKISWTVVLNTDLQKTHPVIDIVSRYCEDCIGFVDKSESSRQDNPIQFEDSRRMAKSLGTPGTSVKLKPASADPRRNTVQVATPSAVRQVEHKSVENDIAFVDCGPTPNNCVAEAPGMSSPVQSLEISEKGSSNKDSPTFLASDSSAAPSGNSLLRKSLTQQNDKLKDKSQDNTPKLSSSLPSIGRAGPRVLTIRGPRNLSLSAIMKHLPTNTINSNKIVVVDDEPTNGFSGASGSPKEKPDCLSETPLVDVASMVSMLPENNDKSSGKPNSSPSVLIKSENAGETAPNAVSQSFSEQMSLHGKIVFQNGRKYIIRHVPKARYRSIVQSSKTSNNSIANPSPLLLPVSKPKPRLLLPKSAPGWKKLPSATPIPLQGTSPPNKSVVIKLKQRRIRPLQKDPTPSNCPLVPLTSAFKSYSARIREARSDLHKSSKKDLNAYIENLKEINEAYAKAMGFDSDPIIDANLKTIELFVALANALPTPKNTKKVTEAQVEDELEKTAREWESHMDNNELKRICDTCDKEAKPKSYIIGVSGPASDESRYCKCYNTVCYVCNTNLGTLLQLKAHIKWHKRDKPFVCPDCAIWFKTPQELEVHIWTTCFHPMVRHVYNCKVCEIRGMLDMEQVAKHFLLMHTRKKNICPECKMEYKETAPTHLDCKRHFEKHHKDMQDIPKPKRLFLCNIKLCVIPPESFRTHLTEHIGIVTSIYYKCPFCPMITRDLDDCNRKIIREHVVANHLDRLHEVVHPDSLEHVLKRIPFERTTFDPETIGSSNDNVSEVSNANTSGPMIINARTITPASFELGTQSTDEQIDDSTLPKILEVRSEATDEFETGDSVENDFTIRLMTVESRTENAAESPVPKSEVSDTMSQESASDELALWSEDPTAGLEMNSLPLKYDVEDDSSNSYEDMTLVLKEDYEDTKMDFNLTSSPPKLERKPSCILEGNDESQEWKEEYQDECLSSSETEKSAQRPWRIALNTPTNAGVTPVAYNCHLCGESIDTSWSVIKNHFSSRHANDYELSVISPQIPHISSGYIEGEYREDCNIRKRKTELACVNPGTKRKRRCGTKKFFEKPGSPSLGLCVRPEPVQEVEGSFRCKKCDELFEEIAMMREHIATKHRIKGQYLICLECGENFVVVPSLQMHLKALHGIQDPITYLSKNTAYAPDTPEDTDEDEKTAESNQCYVCMAVFEDKAAVDKHIRVHGMAFLRRKRFEAQKAQKCSEKKGEPPDNTSDSGKLDDKSKINQETSKIFLNDLTTLDNNYSAGNSDDKPKTVQKPMKFWVKKFDLPIESNADGESIIVQDCTSTTERNSTGILERTGKS